VWSPSIAWLPLEEILALRFSGNELWQWIQDLYDPYLLKDMDKAVQRILEAKAKNERVIIFGDYDVDWVTSTALLMHFFKKIGMQVSYRLPHRVKDWYGLKTYFIDELKPLGVSLVITVDCGTRDIEVIQYAKSHGIDCIITDHHAVPEIIPEEAIAVINPKRLDCEYPFKHLAGAWVAFKLMLALARELFSSNEYQKYLLESIDIAAIGTVADCMPLIGENRIIVLEWLKQIKQSRSRGIKKLIQEKLLEDLDADIFSFLIGPKLNAAGRLDTPYKAVNLILNNGESIDETIQEIETLNEKRKILSKEYFEDALQQIDSTKNAIFYISSEIEHGIIWIVAGRLTELFHKPSIVLKDEWEVLVASCRSPEYFSIVEYLDKFKDYFLRYGGHKQAAGFSINKSIFESFKSEFLAVVQNLDFSEHKKTLTIDKILTPHEFGLHLSGTIQKFKPYWMWNPRPLFLFENMPIEKINLLGTSWDHISFQNPYKIQILGFGFWKYREELSEEKELSFVFDLMESIWMGKKQLKAKVIDIIMKKKEQS